MPTRRTMRRHGPRNGKFTHEVLYAFREMEKFANAECAPGCSVITPCSNCDAWWSHHSTLHKGLGLPPWKWPAFHHDDGSELYESLKAAAEEEHA